MLIDHSTAIPADKFAVVDDRIVFTPGSIRPENCSGTAIRSLPGRRMYWAIGDRLDPREALARAIRRSGPDDLIIVVRDLDELDGWYFAWCAARDDRPSWMSRKRFEALRKVWR